MKTTEEKKQRIERETKNAFKWIEDAKASLTISNYNAAIEDLELVIHVIEKIRKLEEP